MRPIYSLLLFVFTVAVLTQFPTTPFRVGPEIVDEKFLSLPLSGWKLNKKGAEGTYPVRDCFDKILSSPLFTNQAALSNNFNISFPFTPAKHHHIEADLYLIGGWRENDSVIVKVDGQEIWRIGNEWAKSEFGWARSYASKLNSCVTYFEN